jgi:hypothetical protein
MPSAAPATSWPDFLPERVLLETSGEQRREAGRLHFSEALLFLLRHVSHPQLSELADWACNEPGNLHTSQISHMRNNRVRMLGTKALDALGRINQAAWVHRHRPQLLDSLGTGPLTSRLEGILAAYQPLLDPISQEPLGSGALMAIYLGYLRLPIELARSLSPREAELLAGLIGEWLDGALSARGLGFRAAARRLQLAWPGEKAGAERLVRVIGGLEDYSARQLAEDWERIAIAAAAVLEEPKDPWAMADELLATANAAKAAEQVAEKVAEPAAGAAKAAEQVVTEAAGAKAASPGGAATAGKSAARVTPIRGNSSKPAARPQGQPQAGPTTPLQGEDGGKKGSKSPAPTGVAGKKPRPPAQP